MPSEVDNRGLRLDLPKVGRMVVMSSLAIFALGIARELAIGQIGSETLLQDLRHFALDAERSIPAWYSSLLMVGCSLLLFGIGRLDRRDGRADAHHWSLLALIFLAMAMDETVSFHETLIEPMRSALGTSGIFYFAWVIPGAMIVALAGLYFLPFLLRLTRRSAALFTAAGAVYVGGALGLEFVGGWLADAHGMESVPYLVAAMTEEGLEIAGLTIFFLSLTDHLARQSPVLAVEVVSRCPSSEVLEQSAT